MTNLSEPQQYPNALELLDVTAAAVGATGDGKSAIQSESGAYNYIVGVTALGADATDQLSVYIDGSFDGGTTWFNFLRFATIDGADAEPTVLRVLTEFSLSSKPDDISVDQGPGGFIEGFSAPMLRARYAIVDGNAAAFTFKVWAQPN